MSASAAAQGVQETIWTNPVVGTVHHGGLMADVGDMNGDGIRDLAVADQLYANPGGTYGRVQILDGANGATLATVVTPSGCVGFGGSLGRLEDGGLVIGDPFWGQTQTSSAKGKAFVFKNANWITPYASFTGGQLTDGVGSTVSDDLGDVDGDGIADWAHNYQGQVYVWNGVSGQGLHYAVANPFAPTNALNKIVGLGNVDTGHPTPEFAMVHGTQLYVMNGVNGLQYRGPVPGQFIADVVAVGDVTGDSAADYVTSSSPLHPFIIDAEVSLWSGAGTSFLPLWTATGPKDDHFGVDLAAVLDVDGDGTNDVIVGASQPPSSTTGPGYATLLSGADGSHVATYSDPGPNGGEFGRQVISLGDVDGDGAGDVVVTSRYLVSNGGGTVTSFRGAYVDELVPGAQTSCHCFSGPCVNSATSGFPVGCKNSTGEGGRIAAHGSGSVSADNLFFVGRDLPANKVALMMYSGASSGAGTPTLDGSLCLAQVLRFQTAVSTNASGVVLIGPGLAGAGTYFPNHASIGSTIHFQLFYRDSLHGFCTGQGNFTNTVQFPLLP